MKFLEIISGEKLGKPNRGRMRVQKIENLNRCLEFLKHKRIQVGIIDNAEWWMRLKGNFFEWDIYLRISKIVYFYKIFSWKISEQKTLPMGMSDWFLVWSGQSFCVLLLKTLKLKPKNLGNANMQKRHCCCGANAKQPATRICASTISVAVGAMVWPFVHLYMLTIRNYSIMTYWTHRILYVSLH